MKRLPVVRGLLWLMAGVLLSSCGTSTKMTGMWRDEQYAKNSIDNVLVIGMFQRHGTRAAFESHIKHLFIDRGVNAVASLDEMPADEQIEKATLAKYFADKDIDAVIVSRLVAVDQEQTYRPGYAYMVPHAYYHDFYGYYGTSYSYVYSPSYLSTTEIVRVETNLYDTGTEKLVWSGISETMDPKDAIAAIESFGKVLVSSLEREGFLAKKKR